MNRYLLQLFNTALNQFDDFLDEGITTITDPISAILQGLASAIGSVHIPERFYNYTHEEYNPILYYLWRVVESAGPHVIFIYWQDQLILDYWNTNFSGIDAPDNLSQLRFAFLCGAFDEIFNTFEGIPLFMDLLVRNIDEAVTAPFDLAAFLTDENTNLTEVFSAESFENAKELGLSIAEQIGQDIAELHDPNKPYLLAHTLGRDVIFGLSFFVGVGEMRAVSQSLGQLARAAATKMITRASSLRWVRNISNSIPALTLMVTLNTTAPLMDFYRVTDEFIEIGAKLDNTSPDVFTGWVEATVRADAPEVLTIAEKSFVKVSSSPTKPIILKNQAGDVIQTPTNLTNEFQVNKYVSLNDGKSIVLLSNSPFGTPPDGPESDCNVCEGTEVQALYMQICAQANSTQVAKIGLNRLCENLPIVERYPIGEELINWPAATLNSFFTDIIDYEHGPRSPDNIANIPELDRELVIAWEVISSGSDPISIAVRNSLANLDIVDEYLYEYPERVSQVRNDYTAVEEKQVYIDDLLGPGLPGDTVKHRVRGLYDQINPSDNLNEVLIDFPAGTHVRQTYVSSVDPNQDDGLFVRMYDSSQDVFIFDAGFRKGAPKWLDNGQIPLREEDGIPTQMLVTLRQMKSLNIPNESLQTGKLSTIQNIETMLWLRRHQLNNGWTELSEVGSEILNAPQSSISYAIATLKQAGYRVDSAQLTLNSSGSLITEIVTFGDLRSDPREHLNKIRQADLDRYELTWDDTAFIIFNIILYLTPF